LCSEISSAIVTTADWSRKYSPDCSGYAVCSVGIEARQRHLNGKQGVLWC